MKKDRERGSVTVEAAIALPVFISAVVTVIFIAKIIFVHEIIQHAINETAWEISTVSYLSYATGIKQSHDILRDGMDGAGERLKGRLGMVLDAVGGLGDIAGTESLSIDGEGFEISDEEAGRTGDGFGDMLIPVLKDIALCLFEDNFEGLKTEILTPLVRQRVRDYIEKCCPAAKDSGLEVLNIKGGIDGLDFSESRFFEDSNEMVDIIVTYKMVPPLPLKIIPDFEIKQRISVKAMLGGDTGVKGIKNNGEDSDIWSLDNFTRGRIIREIFGGNLPFNFPVLSAFDDGKAVIIKSMDLTAATYQDPEAVIERISQYIDSLSEYKGQLEPWGKGGIIIREEDINYRELVLVVPKNEVSAKINEALRECLYYADSKGVHLRIERYGVKKTASNIENGTGQ